MYKGKRFLDVFVASLLLVISSPVFLLAALAVKIFSGGPVIYHRKIVGMGMGEKPFVMFKFRSMENGTEDQEEALYRKNKLKKPANDGRVTRVGQLLRRTSIDELPQLINVLRGEMSLVGPRPMPAWMVQELPKSIREIRFSLLPGMTGLAQVTDRTSRGHSLDREYCEKHCLWLDLEILLRTIPAIIFGKGAY